MPKWQIITYIGEQKGEKYAYKFPEGCNEVDDILIIIQSLLNKLMIHVEISFNQDIKQVRMKLKTRKLKTKDEAYRLELNEELNKILGFTINAKAVVGHYPSKKFKMVDAH